MNGIEKRSTSAKDFRIASNNSKLSTKDRPHLTKNTSKQKVASFPKNSEKEQLKPSIIDLIFNINSILSTENEP